MMLLDHPVPNVAVAVPEARQLPPPLHVPPSHARGERPKAAAIECQWSPKPAPEPVPIAYESGLPKLKRMVPTPGYQLNGMRPDRMLFPACEVLSMKSVGHVKVAL